ncbi:MAG TPA: ECF-type sigma factor [Thermoanaerobaculia bacterium]|nr:ECF-type sigma factor [Thermoanaerobaculia bacterium]
MSHTDLPGQDAGRLTGLLQAAAAGDAAAYAEVATLTYAELERVAESRLRRDFGPGWRAVTLEPAALVNETFLRLLRSGEAFANRRHFFAFACKVMATVLLDYHRRRGADKRGGDHLRVTLSGLPAAGDEPGVAIPAALAALDELETLDPRKAEVARLRLFWDASVAEIAEIVQVSVPTVERDWRFARVWLAERLGR